MGDREQHACGCCGVQAGSLPEKGGQGERSGGLEVLRTGESEMLVASDRLPTETCQPLVEGVTARAFFRGRYKVVIKDLVE